MAGSFETRTRLLRNAVEAAQAATRSLLITTRLNLYDGFPYPYGFGVSADGGIQPDYREGIALARLLNERYGVPLVNVTIGNPYVNPHVNRPDNTKQNRSIEPPLVGVERILGAAAALKKAVPSLLAVCSGAELSSAVYTHDGGRHGQGTAGRSGRLGAGSLRPTRKWRHKILSRQPLEEKQCCICCGKCSELRCGPVR